MGKTARLLTRWRNTLRRAPREEELDEELSFHVNSRADDLAARGMAHEDAIRQARLEFGGMEKYREQYHDTRLFRPVADFFGDLVQASRGLRRSPALVVTSVLSLALGVGVNTTLFSGITAIYRYQPTAAQLDRLVWVEPGNGDQFSYPNYRDLRDSRIFSSTFGYRPVRLSLRAQEGAEGVNGMAVTANFFEGLGASARLGKTFTAADGEPADNPRLAVISHRFWVNQFQRDPSIVGKTITLNGEPFLVVGVMPESYQPLTLLTDPDFYVPLSRLVMPNLGLRDNLRSGSTVRSAISSRRAPRNRRAARAGRLIGRGASGSFRSGPQADGLGRLGRDCDVAHRRPSAGCLAGRAQSDRSCGVRGDADDPDDDLAGRERDAGEARDAG